MKLLNLRGIKWSGRKDLNLRPPGPEPVDKIISRCPGVTYWFSGRSLMDKSGQAITECLRKLWGIPDRHVIPVSAVYQELTEWKRENGMIATLYLG
jgi:hypothetical protein